MPFGPIVARELLTLARRRRTYGKRTSVPIAMLVLLVLNHLAWREINGGPATVQQEALFGRLMFAQFVAAQVLFTVFLVPELVGSSVAEEKERNTLWFLLATPLSSAAIVGGKLWASLGHYLGCLAAGLPVVLLLPLFGGIEPDRVILAYAGTVSTALFLAGLAMVVSVAYRRGREAKRVVQGLAAAWISAPMFIALAVPAWAPRLYAWIRPLNNLVLTSSPAGLLMNGLGLVGLGGSLEVLGWMIGLQLAGGLILALTAVVILRPLSRRHLGGEASVRRGARKRWRRRPACGDRPMIWKEKHIGKIRGILVALAALAGLVGLMGLGVLTYHFAQGAVGEVLSFGYTAASPSMGRNAFNRYLRVMSLLIGFVASLAMTGIAAEGIAVERLRETWLSLLATPMDGREIVRGKMFGAAWRARGFLLLPLALWVCGLLAGAIHPLGFAAALMLLTASTWFFTSLGTYISLRAKTMSSASSAALIPILVLSLSGYALVAVPEPFNTLWLGVASFPWVLSLAVLSYEDVHAWSSNAFPTTTSPWSFVGSNPGSVVLIYLAAILATLIAAALFDRLACRQFDRLSGRPWRPRIAPEREDDPDAVASRSQRRVRQMSTLL